MSKTEADSLKKISTAFLRKHGYFNAGWRSGTITWTSGWDEHKSSVGIEVSTGDNYLRIHYTQTDRDTDEKKDFDYKIPLTTTPCRYGGNRYWFTCPMYHNQIYCGRRVGVLYKNGDFFACRHCNDLTYESRNLGGRSKAVGAVISYPELEKLEGELTKRYYRGRPTKRYQRFLKKEEKSEYQLIAMAGMLDIGPRKR